MKKILLSLLLLLSINCFSQIGQTWYLYSVQATDLSPLYVVPNISPPISPTLTLNPDFTYTAQGACNTMTGTWAPFFTDAIIITTSNITTNNCSVPIHANFDDSFFNFLTMNGLQYFISADGIYFTLNSPLFGQASLRNTQLQSPGFDAAQLTIYPNPAHSSISLDLGNTVVTKVEFINSLGQSTKTVNDTFETIDIADLPSGIYIMTISSETGTVNKKVIKI